MTLLSLKSQSREAVLPSRRLISRALQGMVPRRAFQHMVPLCLLLSAPALAQTLPLNAPAPSPTPSAPFSSALTPEDAATYVLSPDDQVDISVLGHPEFSATATLMPDGTFNYPIAGKVHAAGLTLDGLTQKLTRGLSSQLNQPEVTVTLKQGRARRVTIVGDGVKTPGQYDFHTGMHLLDLLALAGGPASEPQLVSATLATTGGQTVSIDLAKLLTDADTSQNLPLAPGDILFLVAKNPEAGEVQVVGDVTKPGAYPIMPSGISVLALLNEAGGALPTARLTEVQIMHAGKVQTCDLRPLLTTDLKADTGRLRLVPGDVLLVPANQNHILALGEVRTPGVLPIPDDQPLSLTTAYALVGGATPDGDKKNVDIIRRDSAGKATLIAVNMDDLLQGKNGATDLILRPNDILYIQTRSHPQSAGSILGALSGLGAIATLGRL
jgi:protein involved in polysaccharide export with SLBB domain